MNGPCEAGRYKTSLTRKVHPLVTKTQQLTQNHARRGGNNGHRGEIENGTSALHVQLGQRRVFARGIMTNSWTPRIPYREQSEKMSERPAENCRFHSTVNRAAATPALQPQVRGVQIVDAVQSRCRLAADRAEYGKTGHAAPGRVADSASQ